MVETMTDNSASLSLALDARLAIKALKAYRKAGVSDARLTSAIKDAVASLNALNSEASPYEGYAQLQTLREVQSELSDDNLVQKLGASIDSSSGATRDQDVDYAITFFVSLENRALKKYNQSFGY
jgi:hypothetical protein